MALGLVGKLTVMFGADFKGFDKSIRNATNKLDKFSKKAGRIGSQMTTNLSLPILALGAGAVKLASDFEESLNKVNVSFGESSKEVQSFAKTTLNSFGIAEGSALEMAALFGDMGTSMGLTQKQAAGMSTSLVGLAGDLSSFKNIRIDVAQTALASIFTGETESLKKLGVVMTEANLKQFALEQGITKTIKQMSQAEKVQLRYNFVISQSTNAIGDFARTSDGVANSTRSLQESVKELGEQFGKELLPIASDLINSLSSLVKTLSNMSDENKKLLIDVGLLTAVIGPFITGLASLSTLLKNLITFLPKLIKLITGPLGLAVAFVTAFIKMDEGDGILINLKKRFNELKTAIFGVNEEAKKLDFSIQDLPLDPEEIRKRMLEGKIPFIKTTKKKKTTKTDSKNTNDLSNLKNTTDAANELSLTLQELEQFKPLENMSSISDQFAVEMSLVNEQFEDIVVNLEVFNSKLRESNALNQLFGDVLYDSMMSAANSQESFFSSFIQNIKKAIKQLIIQLAVLTAINILLGGPGVAGNLAKAFTLAKNSILGLANGGLVTGPTMALVGEGAGTTASNPEVVAPLDKLKGMINGGGTQQVEVYGRISGNDIFISNQRGGLNRQRAV
tara:strand:- start:458 stop:2314 length:1857 start_codon:yes stop_codon:yes gene_type:complete